MFFGQLGEGEVFEQLFVGEDVVFDEIEGEHEALHAAYLLLHQFYLINQLGQKVDFFKLQLYQMFLLGKGLLLLLNANR